MTIIAMIVMMTIMMVAIVMMMMMMMILLLICLEHPREEFVGLRDDPLADPGQLVLVDLVHAPVVVLLDLDARACSANWASWSCSGQQAAFAPLPDGTLFLWVFFFLAIFSGTTKSDVNVPAGQ